MGKIVGTLSKRDRYHLRLAAKKGEVKHVHRNKWCTEPHPVAVLQRLGLRYSPEAPSSL